MSEDKITLDNSKDNDKNKISEEAQEIQIVQDENGPVESNSSQSTSYVETSPTDDTDPSEKKSSLEEQVSETGALSDEVNIVKKKYKFNLYKIIRILCLIGFIVFTALFINEVIIQPYRIKKSIDLTRDLYNRPTEKPEVSVAPTDAPVDVVNAEPSPGIIEATPTPDPNRDNQGRLLQFKDLLAINDDIKGWITIKDTNIDYVVIQSDRDKPDYYLDKDINGAYSKAGTLYLDALSSVEADTQNLVIHGHNMVSTAEKMFHYLLEYNDKEDENKLSYYKEHPVIKFDTIYNPGEWKIFSVFITTGDADSKDFFDYRKSSFKNSSDFLNFVYQMRIRSVLNIDTVDINENDQILTLSTCSYELDNYRTVIVARKVREGEASEVDLDSITVNENPLQPSAYYYYKGGEAPELAENFETALANGQITWYTPVETTTE